LNERVKARFFGNMKSLGIVSVFILAAFTAAAQTDTNATAAQADTNAVVAPTDTNAPAALAGTNAAAVPTDTNVVAAPTDTNAVVAPTDTNAPAAQPATNGVAVPTDTNVVAAPAGTNAAVAQPGTNAVPSREMSLTDCIQEALQHNLDVQIERYNPQIQLYGLRAAYGGYDPLFSLSSEHSHDKSGPEGFIPSSSAINRFNSDLSGSLPWGMAYDLSGAVSDQRFFAATNSPSSSGSIQAMLTQPLLKNFWIDNTRLTIRVAKNRLKYSEQGLRGQIIATVSAVETAYYELIYARESVKVQQQALELAQTQLDQDKQRVQIGTLAQLDVQQDKAQVASSRANLIAAQYTLATDQNTLKNLLTDAYSRWHDTDVQPSAALTAPLQLFDLQDSWSKGMTLRPDLLQSRLNVEQQGILLKYDRNQLFPELDLTGTYGYNGAGQEFRDAFGQFREGDRPFYSYGAQLTVPLSNAKARNNYKSSKATLQQVLLQLKQFEQKVMVDIDNAVKQAQSAYESVDATRQARIYAEAALDAEQKKYAVGKSTTFTVLQLQNNLTAARSQEIRSLANYNEALANLAAQEGSTLDRHNINIEAR
jgi:outer membrane protein TolC